MTSCVGPVALRTGARRRSSPAGLVVRWPASARGAGERRGRRAGARSRRRRRGHRRRATPTATPTPSLKVERVQFRGNRKVEDDAIKVEPQDRSPASSLDAGDAARRRPRDLEDGLLRGRPGRGHRRAAAARPGRIVFVLKEKPAIRKIYVAGQRRGRPRKINEVLDLKKDTDPRPVEGQEERREDQRPLRREGLLPRGGRLRAQAQRAPRSTSGSASTRTPRSRSARSTSSATTPSRRRAARRDRDPRGRAGSRSSRSAGTYREDAFERDLLLSGALLGPRLHQREGRQAADRAVARQAVHVHHASPIDEGPQYTLGKIDFKGDLLESKEFFLKRVTVQAGRDLQPLEARPTIQKLTDLYKDKRLRLRQRPAAHAGRREDAHRRPHLRDPEGRAGLLRAHQHPRQHQDARQGHPPRAAHLRGRARTTRRCSTSRSAACTALGFFEKVDVSTKRGVERRQDGRQRRGHRARRPARSRSAPASRRSRTSSRRRRSRRTTCSAAAQTLTLQAQISACASCSCCGSSTRTSSTPTDLRLLLFKQDRCPIRRSPARRAAASLTWGYLLAEDLRVF